MKHPISGVSGFGPKRMEALQQAGILTWEDVLYRLPQGYRDYSCIVPIAALQVGQMSTIRIEITGAITAFRRPGGKHMVKAEGADGSDSLQLIWFNRPYLARTLRRDTPYTLYGRAEYRQGRLQMINPSFVPPELEGGIEPIYAPVGDIAPAYYRKLVLAALEENVLEDLPEAFRREHDLMPIAQAMRDCHTPQNMQMIPPALTTLAFERLFLMQLLLRQGRGKKREGHPMRASWDMLQPVLDSFPYALTGAQTRVMNEIMQDMQRPNAMARLVEGDVGSGKTAIALMSLYLAAQNGLQGAMMAPTELLARQHYQSACRLLEPLGVNCGLLTGTTRGKQRQEVYQGLEDGSLQVVFGTHALITESVVYKKLGLVVTDEQHRFGVKQRGALQEKGTSPHVLVMSATPIPRTLALILYGDLDLSVLDEMPPGRIPVKTHVVPERKRRSMYGFLQQQIDLGHQVYVVCPLVEESEELDCFSAEEQYEEYRKNLPKARVALVHGRMPQKNKQAGLDAFAAKEADVLVSTTVIEVGIDVPNATVMVIENAERFGLTQLHQLRGRVGRGGNESFCFLMAHTNDRLRVLTQTNDGFVIAQEDLKMRGPGDLLGTRQHGLADSGASLFGQNAMLLEQAHEAAVHIENEPGELHDRLYTRAKEQYGHLLANFFAN